MFSPFTVSDSLLCKDPNNSINHMTNMIKYTTHHSNVPLIDKYFSKNSYFIPVIFDYCIDVISLNLLGKWCCFDSGIIFILHILVANVVNMLVTC